MPRTLDVYLNRALLGNFVQDDHGEMSFSYGDTWLSGPDAHPLSHSLPLRKEPFSRRECAGFFAGILPEEDSRKIVASNLGISAQNDFAMLWEIGGECAGAVTFIPHGQSLRDEAHIYRLLTSHEFAELLAELPRRPLLAGDDGVRLSLAGAQNKIAVHISSGRIAIPLYGAPSSHIIKPAIEQFAGIVYNEAFCMRLANGIGLPVAKAEVANLEGIEYLCVERYDRVTVNDRQFTRLHQEDFCQALNVVPNRKYQNEGGPGLKQCFDLVRAVSSAPVIDLKILLDGVIFNLLIGNNDAHGKNFSLLYLEDLAKLPQTRLAPFYDLIRTAYYPGLAAKMAMKLGGAYAPDKLSADDFDRFSNEVGLSPSMVRKRVKRVAETVLHEMPNVSQDNDIASGFAECIERRCRHILGLFGD